MKTILHLITDLRLGGTATLLLERVTRLKEFRHEVLVYDRVTGSGGDHGHTPDLFASLSSAGVPVHSLDLHSPREAAWAWLGGRLRGRLRDLLRETRPDLLHSTLFHSHFLAARLSRWSGRAYLASKEGVEMRRNPLERRLEAAAFRRAARVVAVSGAARDIVLRLGASADKIRVIPNGIDPSLPGRWSLPAIGADGSAPRLLGVGRLDPAKGWQDLLDALPILSRRWPDLRLDLIGQGAYESVLRRRAQRLGVDARVRFIHQVQVGDAAPKAAPETREGTILVVPSREEGFGLVLLEGMARGLPIVATHAGGIPEVARDGREALLVPPADPSALAGAIEGLIMDASLAARLAAAGRKRVEEFPIERTIASYGDLYREALEEAH